MMTTNNRIVLDLNKVQWASHYYRNQWGDFRHTKPKEMTIYNFPVNPKEKSPDGKLMIDIARERELEDRWEERVKFQLTANHCITYTGKKAASLWKAWCEKVFKPYMKRERKK